MPDSIQSYLAELGSSAPTPGGGAAAAITGAQAAALLEMVCNLSKGKRFAQHQDEISNLCDICHDSTASFLTDATADQLAFSKVMKAYRLPESENKNELLQTALADAAEAPLTMIRRVLKLIPICERLAEIGNGNLISDVGVAIHLLDAAFESARLNVLINLKSIKDQHFVEECHTLMAQCSGQLKQLKAETLPIINQTME